MKKIIFSIIFSLFVINTNAQSLTKKQQIALNNYMTVVNKSVENVTKILEHLQAYYINAEQYKNQNITVIKQYSCKPLNNLSQYYELAKTTSINLNQIDAKELNFRIKLMNAEYNKIINKSNELQIYIRNKNYKTDNLTKSDLIIKRMEHLFKSFRQSKRIMGQIVYRTFRNIQPFKTGNQYNLAEKNMRTYILDEIALLNQWEYNFNPSVYTNRLPINKLTEYVKKVNQKSTFSTTMSGLKKTAYNYYKKFFDTERGVMQNTKREIIKANNNAAKQNDRHSNYAYKTMVFKLNEELMSWFTLYASFDADDGQRIVKHGKFCPVFNVDTVHQKSNNLGNEIEKDISKINNNKKQENKIATENKILNNDKIITQQNIKKAHQSTREKPDDKILTSMEGYADNNLVLVLDISASMNAPNKLPLLKKSLKRLLTIMRAEDEISIITYSSKAKIILKPTSSHDKKIIEAINKLKPGGGSNAKKGIKLAYKLANKNHKEDGNNRIILATDGEFEVGNNIHKLAIQNTNNDIFLTIFTLGIKRDSDKLKRLANSGNGNYENITKVNTDLKLVKEAKSKLKKK